MKQRVLLFITMVLLLLALVPAVNLSSFDGHKKKHVKWWKKPALYNIDFMLPYICRLLYPLGISMDHNVVIGKNHWLYIGDSKTYANGIYRLKPTEQDLEVINQISIAFHAWDKWLKQHGVRVYKIMLGPEKSSIYPEFLPHWAQPARKTVTDRLIDEVGKELYFDTRSPLIAAKNRFSETLYYPTDTHWNNLGAYVAFIAFMKEISQSESQLRFISEEQIEVSTSPVSGLGLASFLRMADLLRDKEVIIDIQSTFPIETKQFDYETGESIFSYGNPQIPSPERPLLVKSPRALNVKKVLWLRDSFGTAMAPLMAVTFSETLQVYHANSDPYLIAQLIERYQPDYVFVTIVERSARASCFAQLPPKVAADKIAVLAT